MMRSVHEQSIQQDLHRLAGSLPHRSANTESERSAADYILSRFKTFTADAGNEEFDSVDGYRVLFAGYYSEFALVAVFAIWLPWFATAYGAAIFMAYLAEISGYRLLGRLLTQFQSQNVSARILADRPRRLYILTAHYDTGKASPLSHPVAVRWLRWVHLGIVLAMVLCITSCLTDAANVFVAVPWPVDSVVRWCAVAVLVCAGGFLLYCEAVSEPVRGALGNASGVAALLEAGQSLADDPFEEADVWLVATGSKEGWMNGMRHFLASHELDPATTHIINLEYLGAPQLRYVTAEGLLHRYPCDSDLVRIAEAAGSAYSAVPYVERDLPTDLLMPLTRGLKAIGITSTEDDGTRPHRLRESDSLAKINAEAVASAAHLCVDMLRALDEERARQDRPSAPSPYA
jgi:hypothetical protein